MTVLSRRATGATIVALIVALIGVAALPALTRAEEPANDAFQRSWERTDRPVSELVVSRTWIWSPKAFTPGILEPYEEAPGGVRLVQYFDKSRKEMNLDPNVDPSSPWFVINGLLATELITGRLQLGHDTFEQYEPAQINIAGDPDDTNAPTYATFNGLMDLQTFEQGSLIGATVNRNGSVGQNPALREHGVTASTYVQETEHTVASVFWQFMLSEGPIYVNGQLTHGPLFQDAFSATGLPITEAYWTSVLVGGQQRDVLVQAFERRVLTYTPDNPEGWRVEAGNVGRHYFEWRYEIIDQEEPVVPPPATPVPTQPTDPPETPDPTGDVPEAGLGMVGIAGTTPLGEDRVSEHAEPYLAVPVGDRDVIGWTVATKRSPATLNQQFTISLVNNTRSPSGKLYYVVDFNDGSIYVSPIIDANLGINVTHTWRGRGVFYPKAWSIDPETGIRTEITEWVLEVR